MSGEVVSFSQAQERRDIGQAEYQFSLDVSVTPMGSVSGRIHGWELSEEPEGDRLRQHAALLDAVAFMIRQRAEQIDKSDDGSCLATIQIYESSRVRLRMNDDKIVTNEQRDWLAEQIGSARDMVLEEKQP